MDLRCLSRLRQRFAAGPLAEAVALALLATFSVAPAPGMLRDGVPLGYEGTPTVPLFNLWTVAWNGTWWRWPACDYWEAPIFFPEHDTFALSETQPATIAVAPLVWLTGTPIAAYNVWLLGTLFLNGWVARWLLRLAGQGRTICFAGGALMIGLPFVHWQIGVLQLTTIWGPLLALGLLLRFAEQPSVKRGVWLGAGYALAYLLCNYYGLFLSVLLTLTAPILGRRSWLSRTGWAGFAAAALTAGLLVSPVLSKQLQVRHRSDWTRSDELVTGLSAHLDDYGHVPPRRFAWCGRLAATTLGDPARASWMLGIGTLTGVLAAAGIVGGLCQPSRRRWTGFLLALLVIALGASLGTRLGWRGWTPYNLLRNWYPGFAEIRSPFRFAVFVQMAAVLLAAEGLRALADWRALRIVKPVAGVRRWPRLQIEFATPAEIGPEETEDGQTTLRSRGVPAFRAVAAALGLLAIIESCPAPVPVYRPPSSDQAAGWTTWLRTHAAGTPVICFPFSTGSTVEAYADNTLWMYHGLQHRSPLANGYSGYFPDSFNQLRSRLLSFPDEASLSAIQDAGIRYCVARRDFGLANKLFWAGMLETRLTLVHADDQAGVDIFEIPPKPPSLTSITPNR